MILCLQIIIRTVEAENLCKVIQNEFRQLTLNFPSSSLILSWEAKDHQINCDLLRYNYQAQDTTTLNAERRQNLYELSRNIGKLIPSFK